MRRLRGGIHSAKMALAQDLRDIKNPFRNQVLKEGKDAAWDGWDPSENPYPDGSDLSRIWDEGADRAQLEIKKVESEFQNLKKH